MTHEFDFEFTSREQFYAVVHLLNHECGKGKWTIRGRVLKGLKRVEKYQTFYTSFKDTIKKKIVVPAEHAHIEAMLRFVHGGDIVNK